jgi:hypothetical protein
MTAAELFGRLRINDNSGGQGVSEMCRGGGPAYGAILVSVVARRVGVLSAASESDCPCLVDGGQGNGAGCESEGVDPVPPLQQGFAAHLAERLWAEEQVGVDGPEQVRGGGRARRGAGGSHYEPDPAVGMIPTCNEGSDGGWGVDRGDRGVVAAGASGSKGGPREFTACFRGRDPMRDFDKGLIEIAEEPVRVAELRDTQEPISEQVSTA